MSDLVSSRPGLRRAVAAAACAAALALTTSSGPVAAAPAPTSPTRTAALPSGVQATTLPSGVQATALPALVRATGCPHTTRRGDRYHGCWAMLGGATDASLRECRSTRAWLRTLVPPQDRPSLRRGQCQVRWAQWNGKDPIKTWGFVWSVTTKNRILDDVV